MTNQKTISFDIHTTDGVESTEDTNVYYTDIDEVARAIVDEVKRASSIRAWKVSNNRDRYETLIADMSSVNSDVLFQILDKPSFWNLRGIRSTVNLCLSDYIRREMKHRARCGTYANMSADSYDDQAEVADEVVHKLVEVGKDFSENSDNAVILDVFFASKIYLSLTDTEKFVLELYGREYNITEISRELGIGRKSVERTMKRIKKLAAKHQFTC